ncbi:MAG: hypothetical protein NUV45_08355 [Tepidanaerobacteraceae bacterium]|jgi:hypothetical protein|nr:hypothetical protein [Tepidanaerobacteraceae bacterium]
MVIEDMLELGMAAMLPVYEGGNATRLIASDGTEMMDSRTCRTVLKYFARLFGIDLPAVRESYGRAINKRHAVPIPFGANMILMPVKIREKPLGENDGTLGYVNFKEVLQVEDESGRSSRMVLRCGKAVDILASRATVLEYMKNARLVESLYMDRHFHGVSAGCKGTGSDAAEVKDASFYSPLRQEQDLVRESREDLRFLQEKGFLQENPQDHDDLLRIYLLELLVRALLQRKNDKNSN